jgi:hypothetical protein
VAISGGGDSDPALPKDVRVDAIEGTAKGEHSLRRPVVDAVLATSDSRLESRLVTDLRHEANAPIRGVVDLKQTLRVTGDKRENDKREDDKREDDKREEGAKP